MISSKGVVKKNSMEEQGLVAKAYAMEKIQFNKHSNKRENQEQVVKGIEKRIEVGNVVRTHHLQ